MNVDIHSDLLHKPVMTTSINVALVGARYIIDATFGSGGHSRALLKSYPQCTVIAIDRDPTVQKYADNLAREFPGRIHFLFGNFSDMQQLVIKKGINNVDAVLFDLGVSSMQLNQAVRGFSFQKDGPLDMRMSKKGITAADIINRYNQQDLYRIIRYLGEEKLAASIVRNIIRHRVRGNIERTDQLRTIIHEVKQRRRAKIDPATKTFQALRMYVNDELGALKSGLNAAKYLLKKNGILAVLSFNSLEDRFVKHFLLNSNMCMSRHTPHLHNVIQCFSLINRKPLMANIEECTVNPRARSAKLRMARKILSQ